MADDKESKTPKAIQKHKPEPTLEMNSAGGRSLQKANANRQVNQDYAQHRRERAMKHAKKDKAIASKENVREGTRGKLTKEFKKERER